MTDPTQEPDSSPPILAQLLRIKAGDMAHGHLDLATAHLLRKAATALEEAVAELASQAERLGKLHHESTDVRVSLCAILGVAMTTDIALLGRLAAERLGEADPPNRAPLLAQLEALLTSAPTNLGPIREAIRVIRTEAQLREVTRAALKDWHGWARKLSRAEGDEYASAMRATLQARIAAQHESGRLALLVEPVRRRVELVQALCADIGLGAEEAAELAPRAALWTDAEVAEIEAFRVRDWSGTGLNPFEHLPPALERAVYPGPGGRRAYLQRIGDPLPPDAPASAVGQLGLPGLPKPETALRLRLALVNKPDSPEAGLVAEFAQALLEKLDAVHGSRDLPADYHPWMASDWVDEVRAQVRLHVQKGDPRDVAVYCAFAWHHGWSLTQEPQESTLWELIAEQAHGKHCYMVDKASERGPGEFDVVVTSRDSAPVLEAIEARFTELHFLAEPNRVGFRFEGVPFDIRVPDEDAKAMRRKLIENFTDTSSTRLSAQSLYQRIANVCTALTEEYDSGLPHTAMLLLREAMPLLKANGENGGEAGHHRKREFFRALQAGEIARDHHADLRHAMGHTTRDTAPKPGGPQDIDAIHKVVTMLITAEPALDIDCFPIDPATGRRQLEGEGGLEMAARLLRLAHERGAFDASGSPTTRHWRNTALYLWHCLAEIERLDPSDTELSKVQFRGEVRRLAAKRLDMFSAETYAKLDTVAPDKSE